MEDATMVDHVHPRLRELAAKALDLTLNPPLQNDEGHWKKVKMLQREITDLPAGCSGKNSLSESDEAGRQNLSALLDGEILRLIRISL